MTKLLFLIVLAVAACCQINKDQLASQIRNTEELLQLYSKKLILLQDLYFSNFPNTPLQHFRPNFQPGSMNVNKPRISQHLVELKKFQKRVQFLPKSFLLHDNKVIKAQNYEEVAQFLGDVLLIQENKITTIVGGKLGMSVLNENQGTLRKEEFLLGQGAIEMDSLWHRNFNIKDGEDILIQWEYNKIYFRGYQTKELEFPPEEQLLSIYSLNQYKIIFVSTLRVGTINSRSLQMGESIQVKNITRISERTQEEVQIVTAKQMENVVFLLLSTGELAKYFNDRIVMVQGLPKVKEELSLLPFQITIQIVGGYLFIIDKENALMRVFSVEGGRFTFNFALNLPQIGSGSKDYQLYKTSDSIRLLGSSSSESRVYEILMPIVQDSSYTPSYLKVIGVIAVIGCFIYFKVTRADSPKENLRQKLDRKAELQKAETYRYAGDGDDFLKKKRSDVGGKQKKT